ncbi:MAG TPA: antitoxin [Segeticoccus sp.]|jgi:hypothetical protein|nr:antitoxin [Segeticoccus sp.]
MGFMDDMKDKAQDATDEHGERIGQGIDKGGDFVDEKTGGQHGDQIDSGGEKLKDGLDGLDGQNDDIGGGGEGGGQNAES